MRNLKTLFASLFLFASLSVPVCAQDSDLVPGDQVNPGVAKQIEVWVEEMDSSKFAVRRNAARQLERIGSPAIKPLESLVLDGSSDASNRAFEILQKHLHSDFVELSDKARESIKRIAATKDHPKSGAAERMLTPAIPKETERPRFRQRVPQQQQMARRTQVRVSSVNGKRDISVDLDGEKYRFRDTANGIRVERPDGKGGVKTKEYKDADEMKKADNEAHQIYKRYASAMGGGGIRIQMGGGAFPGFPPIQNQFPGNPFGNPFPQMQPGLPVPNVPQIQRPNLRPLPPKAKPNAPAPNPIPNGSDIIEV